VDFKRYKKGSHTYTRLGKSVEVRDDRPRSLPVEFSSETAEVYSNAFEISCDARGFRLDFGRHLPPAPADKLLDRRTVRLTWQTAVRLKQDLETLHSKDLP
jgi:hypothetical protein